MNQFLVILVLGLCFVTKSYCQYYYQNSGNYGTYNYPYSDGQYHWWFFLRDGKLMRYENNDGTNPFSDPEANRQIAAHGGVSSWGPGFEPYPNHLKYRVEQSYRYVYPVIRTTYYHYQPYSNYYGYWRRR
ncbi:hypothetical protein WR25_23834 [Diploscapter pachys]|uniref:Uncharacterized protein n=1 Tax=Diploscapter pachys TaxID=2018661 RepID=A0A2A2J828_9BILA|nr:hypothetical protein WR25_23834 [Diploscapter pachys]